MKRIVNVVCVAAAMLCLAGPASATPVTFQGGVFDVTVSDLGSDVYRFVYTADFTAWDDTPAMTTSPPSTSASLDGTTSTA